MERDISTSTSEKERSHDSSVRVSTPMLTLNVPETKSSSSSELNVRQNHVTTVMLAGVPIVCLFIDGCERLCLAQISNTLLKSFSYNEIHNRRVALGITCVQCTPVQLEILRRAGAMPISSRRCGMITKREAERLVKSFLEDNTPPKLPENFCFEVEHNCGWGCRGKFEPSRYNSSRAKCIKCCLCNLYFSPNKFIFHFHRTPESKYNHPDAANFNSWRRHLVLVQGSDTDDVVHAWEDVKAMFNGGSRKRMISGSSHSSRSSASTPASEIKKPKLHMEDNILAKPSYSSPYPSYPVFPVPGKTYPFNQFSSPNPLALSFPIRKEYNEGNKGPSIGGGTWRSPTDFIIPPYDIFWANQFNVRSRAGNYDHRFYGTSPVKDLISSDQERQSPSETTNSSDEDDGQPADLSSGLHSNFKSRDQRLSAFRPVHKMDSPKSSDNPTSDIEEGDNSDIDIVNETLFEKMDDVKASSVENEHVIDGRLDSPDTNGNHDTTSMNEPKIVPKDNSSPTEDRRTETDGDTPKEEGSTVSVQDTTDETHISENPSDTDFSDMTKEELQLQLERELETRRQIEGDVDKIKGTYEDQVSREKTQRDEIAKQLQIVKDALCNELAQERKLRFSMQQKLKEAHDALHSFSCKMLASRQCAECAFKEATLPR